MFFRAFFRILIIIPRTLNFPVKIFIFDCCLQCCILPDTVEIWILYKETTGENISRRNILFQLEEKLADEYEKKRHEKQQIQLHLQQIHVKSLNFQKRENQCQVKHCSGNRAT